MADKTRYPQIPSTVWWGVRAILQKTPSATVDERLLGVQLGVQEAAARAYINELRSVGVLTEEGKASPLAQKWRLDDSYAEAVTEIVENVYPEGLRHLAPPGEAERNKVVSWFLREGLGQGAAGNKAATYLLLSSLTPNEAPKPTAKATTDTNSKPRQARGQPMIKPKRDMAAPEDESKQDKDLRRARGGVETLPLNVSVQIHISADAGSEQIESIFQAMRRYLYDAPDT